MQTTAVNIEQTASLLKVMSDKTRLSMLKMLESSDYCVCEFVDVFEMSQPAISQHVRKLKDAQLVTETRKGQWNIYSLNTSHEQLELIRSVLAQLPAPIQKKTSSVFNIICN